MSEQIIKVKVNKLIAEAITNRLVVSDSVGFVYADFDFDDEWEGLNKTATFYVGDTAKDVLLTENRCEVPWELLTEGAELKITISGRKTDFVIITKEMSNGVTVWQAGKHQGTPPGAYTPELWEQVLAKLNTKQDTLINSGASVDDYIKVTSVDANGKPTGFVANKISHAELVDKDENNQHTIESITDLSDVLTEDRQDIDGLLINYTRPGIIPQAYRINIAGGDSFPTILGKIQKWFSDIKALAFLSQVTKSNLAASVQASLDKADTAVQPGDIADFVTTQALATALTGYVAKVTGKDLSSNDFTDALKQKLETTTIVTQAEKAAWYSKQSTTISDAGGYFTTDTVEGALQEIGAEIAGINTLIGNGVIA